MTWQVQQAKARFSQLLEEADDNGPQIITKHGNESSVVISIKDYRELTAQKKPDLRDYLLSGPKFDSFHVPRSKDRGRKIKL
jgi:prevent-host-death family protein